MRPSEIQTNETLKFVLESLPAKGQRILEIGCGSGEVAKRLQEFGNEVIALDNSQQAVEASKRLGVDARWAEFPQFDEAPFDTIVFTRSLHHIRPLAPAINQAYDLMKPSGLLVVEDFAYSETNEYTAAWFYRVLKLFEACGVLLPVGDTFGRKLLKGGGDISLWRDHVHEINTAQEVLQAISERFDVLEIKLAPYLYRYASEMLSDDDRSGRIISSLLELERETGSKIDHFDSRI